MAGACGQLAAGPSLVSTYRLANLTLGRSVRQKRGSGPGERPRPCFSARAVHQVHQLVVHRLGGVPVAAGDRRRGAVLQVVPRQARARPLSAPRALGRRCPRPPACLCRPSGAGRPPRRGCRSAAPPWPSPPRSPPAARTRVRTPGSGTGTGRPPRGSGSATPSSSRSRDRAARAWAASPGTAANQRARRLPGGAPAYTP